MRQAMLVFLLLCGIPATAHGVPITPEQVPVQLRAWIPWALHGSEEARCPYLAGKEDEQMCTWPARLDLALDKRGGRFSQQWLAGQAGGVQLPGDPSRWPLEVKLNGKPAVVLSGNGEHPTVQVPAGSHKISGVFRWDTLPDSLRIPADTGLLKLSIAGRPVPFPERDAEGQLWLRRQSQGQNEQDSLEIVVHRRVLDHTPLLLTTRVVLYVSGKSREVLLGQALWGELTPMAITSQLPARVEGTGRLRVQVRPGKWVVELVARLDQPVKELKLPPPGGPWAKEEIWAFAAQNRQRLVWIKGVPTIDPQQTTLPAEWKQLPTYRVRPGETFVIEQRRRGDSDPPPDRLSLHRELWLDFDGGGLTIADDISGVLRRSWRLEMQRATTLGRVAVDNVDQLITVQGEGGLAGVEIRQGKLKVRADSRYLGPISTMPAVGWNHDFYQVGGTLHLPPGWRLFNASGVDEVSQTWIKKWSLLDLFLMLLISLAVGKLYGWRWAALALITLGLTLPEPEAPRWIWIVALALEALRRVLPDGLVNKTTRLFQLTAGVVLVMIALPFMIQQARHGMYPVLEQPYRRLDQGRDQDIARQQATTAAQNTGVLGLIKSSDDDSSAFAVDAEQAIDALVQVKPKPALKIPQGAEDEKDSHGIGGLGLRQQQGVLRGGGSSIGVKGKGRGIYGKLKELKLNQQEFNLLQHDPAAKIQTGPGLQRWAWNQVDLKWSGPVNRDQPLKLTLIPPWLNLLLGFLRAISVALLVVLVLRLLSIKLSRLGGASAAAAVLIALAAPAHAELPSDDLLGQLEQRLLEKPSCLPHCAACDRLWLEARGDQLRLRLEVGAVAPTVIPLPGKAKQWLPRRVLVDGKAAAGLAQRQGQLWLLIAPGKHQILLEGPLSAADTIQLALPLKPRRVEARVEGWRLEGVHEDGLADDDLQLTRLRQKGERASSGLQPGVLPPFVQIERRLTLGLSWQITTTITRQTPVGNAVVLEVPLLTGESITTAKIRVLKGKALINLGPDSTQASWSSVLKEAKNITLRAPEGVSWSEVWRLDASPIWHVEIEGFPPVHPQHEARQRPFWRPWPGESLTLKVTRPAAISGQTLTVDSAKLLVRPGQRATDVTLDIALRSSRGIQHTITLPPSAQLQAVKINGNLQPVRQEGRKVTLPLRPGAQEVTLLWREAAGVSARFMTPTLSLGSRAVNVSTIIEMPSDRWILLTGGPRAGPAVLFWSLLLVLLLVSAVLGRVRLTPLRTHHWMLLAVGLSQVPIWAAGAIAGWLLFAGWRQRTPLWGARFWFDMRQLLIFGWTIVALFTLFNAIQQGLLGEPEMQIRGNASHMGHLQWFSDHADKSLPQAWVISVPMTAYRLAMLAWALWLAWALIGWLRWTWGAFSDGGLWRRLRTIKPGPAQNTSGPITDAGADSEAQTADAKAQEAQPASEASDEAQDAPPKPAGDESSTD